MRDSRKLRAHPNREWSLKINWQAFEYYGALEKLQTYVNQHPDMSLTLTEAAAIAGMESTHFSKFFHKKTGVCFKYWEDLRKVERAISLFDATDISVTEAGFKAGFNDLTTFERTFKRIKRITPLRYKRRPLAA
jgi:AraC-like DNA-binding protein